MVRDIFERTQKKGGKMFDLDQGEFLLSQLLLAEDTALVAESAEQLQ